MSNNDTKLVHQQLTIIPLRELKKLDPVKGIEETEWSKNKLTTYLINKQCTVPAEILLTINIISRTMAITTKTIKLIINVLIVLVTRVKNGPINWNNTNNVNNNDSNDTSSK